MSNVKNNLNKWEIWTKTNGRTPNRHSEDKDEARLAGNISRIYNQMKKRPEKYAELIKKYEEIYCQYNKRHLVCKDIIKAFQNWKIWVYNHNKLPRERSEERNERCIAAKFSNALRKMKKNKEKYSKELSEYEELRNRINKQQRNERYDMVFASWKNWVEKNKRFPKLNSDCISERQIAKKMEHVLSVMRKNSGYETLFNSYMMIKAEVKKFQKIKRNEEQFSKVFEQWKAFVEINDRLPRILSNDKSEKNLVKRMAYAIYKYSKSSEECKNMARMYTQYCKDFKNAEKMQHYRILLEQWKVWVEKNGRLPKPTSQSEEEKRLAFNIYNMIRNLKRLEDSDKSMLDEYDNICKQYADRRILSTGLQNFEEWKMWIEKNGRLPDRNSNDKIERGIAYNMYNTVRSLNSINNIDIISEYREICQKYISNKKD